MVDNILVRLSSIIFVVVVITLALIISLALVNTVLTKLQAQTQQNQTLALLNKYIRNQTIPTKTTIAGLTAPQVMAAEKALDRQVRSAQLHNSSETVTKKLFSKLEVFQCANDLIRPNGTDIFRDAFRNANLNFCDVQLPTVIEDHSLGNNQTLIKIARDYLKQRGIQ